MTLLDSTAEIPQENQAVKTLVLYCCSHEQFIALSNYGILASSALSSYQVYRPFTGKRTAWMSKDSDK